jgi:thiol-disulfide isomerase/thioredoxin
MSEESAFFTSVKSRRLTVADFDEAVNQKGLGIVFMWGHDCPNCDIAKGAFNARMDEVLKRKAVRWFDVNVYEESDLGTRFGLFGIPVFLFFKDGKNIGRITSFPGVDRFLETVDRYL